MLEIGRIYLKIDETCESVKYYHYSRMHFFRIAELPSWSIDVLVAAVEAVLSLGHKLLDRFWRTPWHDGTGLSVVPVSSNLLQIHQIGWYVMCIYNLLQVLQSCIRLLFLVSLSIFVTVFLLSCRCCFNLSVTTFALWEDMGRCLLTIHSTINNDICDKRCGHPSSPAMLDSVCRWSRDENLTSVTGPVRLYM